MCLQSTPVHQTVSVTIANGISDMEEVDVITTTTVNQTMLVMIANYWSSTGTLVGAGGLSPPTLALRIY